MLKFVWSGQSMMKYDIRWRLLKQSKRFLSLCAYLSCIEDIWSVRKVYFKQHVSPRGMWELCSHYSSGITCNALSHDHFKGTWWQNTSLFKFRELAFWYLLLGTGLWELAFGNSTQPYSSREGRLFQPNTSGNSERLSKATPQRRNTGTIEVTEKSQKSG